MAAGRSDIAPLQLRGSPELLQRGLADVKVVPERISASGETKLDRSDHGK